MSCRPLGKIGKTHVAVNGASHCFKSGVDGAVSEYMRSEGSQINDFINLTGGSSYECVLQDFATSQTRNAYLGHSAAYIRDQGHSYQEEARNMVLTVSGQLALQTNHCDETRGMMLGAVGVPDTANRQVDVLVAVNMWVQRQGEHVSAVDLADIDLFLASVAWQVPNHHIYLIGAATGLQIDPMTWSGGWAAPAAPGAFGVGPMAPVAGGSATIMRLNVALSGAGTIADLLGIPPPGGVGVFLTSLPMLPLN